MSQHVVPGLFAIMVGLFSFLCAFYDVAWFMEHYKARALVGLIGRSGARTFYMGLGVFLMGLGSALVAGFL